MTAAEAAGYSLNEDLGIGIDENGHEKGSGSNRSSPVRFNGFWFLTGCVLE